MKIKVKYVAVLGGLTDRKEKVLDFRGERLGELVSFLRDTEPPAMTSRMFDGEGRMRADIVIFINGVDSALKGGNDAQLRDGDEVVFLPTVHGG